MQAKESGRAKSEREAVDFDVVQAEELELIRNRRDAALVGQLTTEAADAREEYLYCGQGAVGLALSGGGVRSATFGLGVLQYLAKQGLLKHVDYLSTVSGGGYIGSSLTWLLYGKHGLFPPIKANEIDARFPYGVDSADRRVRPPLMENELLTYLRGRGRYLTPGKGVTIGSVIAVVLRGVALNFLVWGPLVTGFILLLFWAKSLTDAAPHDWPRLLAAAWGYLWSVPWSPNSDWSGTLNSLSEIIHTIDCLGEKVTFTWALIAVCVLAGLFLLFCIIYSVGTYAGFDRLLPELGDDARYFSRRLFEKASRLLLGIMALLLVLGSIPIAVRYLGGALSGGVLLSGIVGGFATFAKSLLDGEGGRLPISRLAPIAALLFLYGFGAVSYLSAVAVYADSEHLRQIYAQLLAISIVTGIFVNINMTTLHRFYRDRLMEAFLPDASKRCGGMAMQADSGFLCDMVDQNAPHGPYHIINTHFIVTSTDNAKLKLRGGDSFILSPLYCGCAATRWRFTRVYSERLSLSTAMAISGAAANPNAGVGGMGVTRNMAVALVMSLLNVRLGYWLPNPSSLNKVLKHCNHFSPGLTAAFTAVSKADDTRRRWLQLSDGGHFDNTGMYELFRRRVRLILFCDASSDPQCQFGDLFNAIERAHADFGVVVDFVHGAELEFIAPHDDKMDYPIGMKPAQRPYALARIIYPPTAHAPEEVGLLVLLTTVVTRHASPTLIAHKDFIREFPDESTMDQFFEEGQFEAYRELGWNVAWQTVKACGIDAVGGYIRIPKFDPERGRNAPIE